MAEIAGLKLIVPSSVSSSGSATVSVSATGKVTFANISTSDYAQINGCFSADYDNYLIVFAGTGSGDASIYTQLSASGTPATSGYVEQFLLANATTISGRRDNPGDMEIGVVAGTGVSGSHAYFYGPYLAQPTAARTVIVLSRDGGRILDKAMTHSTSSSYDGMRLTASVNTASGAFTIYGLSQ